MLFSSYTFVLLFLPLTLVGFRLLSSRRLSDRGISWPPIAGLAAASLVFYGWNTPRDLIPLVASVLVNYTLGRLITRSRTFPLLVTGVVLNLGLLGYFKYTGFLLETFASLTGVDSPTWKIVLPLGISFFTFQQIAYLVDTYRGLTEEHRFIHYCLFVTFFPQLIAGPIVHHRTMLPQFTAGGFRFRARDLSVGWTIFTIGLAKKVLIADEVSGYVGEIYDGGGELTLAQAWMGSLAYTVQIYFDFSGYSDMAIGMGRLFGIRLPLNFHSPYKARSIIDFWRRWHMTLSAFLRDYLYFSLGGGRCSKVRRYANLMITMLLGGLWHGAGWTFVIWGGLHGTYLMVNHGWRAIFEKRGQTPPSGHAWGLGCGALTFLAVVLAWVLFRCETLDNASRILSAMSGISSTSLDLGELKPARAILIVVALVAAWILPNTQELLRAYRPAAGASPFWKGPRRIGPFAIGRFRWRPTVGWSLFVAILFIASLIQMSRVGEFIYFRF